MSPRSSTSDRMARAQELLVGRVGGYLRNAYRQPRITCRACTAPVIEVDRCARCRSDHLRYGAALADLVAPVAYGGQNVQSKQLLHGYKDPFAAAEQDARAAHGHADAVRGARTSQELYRAAGRRADRDVDHGPLDPRASGPSAEGTDQGPPGAYARGRRTALVPATTRPAIDRARPFHCRPGRPAGRAACARDRRHLDHRWTCAVDGPGTAGGRCLAGVDRRACPLVEQRVGDHARVPRAPSAPRPGSRPVPGHRRPLSRLGGRSAEIGATKLRTNTDPIANSGRRRMDITVVDDPQEQQYTA